MVLTITYLLLSNGMGDCQSPYSMSYCTARDGVRGHHDKRAVEVVGPFQKRRRRVHKIRAWVIEEVQSVRVLSLRIGCVREIEWKILAFVNPFIRLKHD